MSVEGTVFLGGLLVLAAIGIIKAVVIVRPHERAVVERMGKYNRTLSSGMNIILPFIEEVRKVDMRETLIDVPAQEVITKDNVNVAVDAVIYFQVIDPFKVIYNVAMFELAAIKLAQTNLRNLMGDMTLDEALVSREKINIELRRILDDATDRWGVRVTRVEIQKIDPPKDIVEAMGRQMKAERTKRAVILEAEGLKQAQILNAEGVKQAEVLKADGQAKAMITMAEAERQKLRAVAEGEANAIERVYGAIHKGNPTRDLLTIKYLESLKHIADGQSTKIFMPLDTSGVLSGVAALSEVFSDKTSLSKHRKEKTPRE